MNGALLLSCYPCFVVNSSYQMTGFGEMEPMSCAGLCSLELYFWKERGSSAIHWRFLFFFNYYYYGYQKPLNIKDVLLSIY